MAKIALAQFRSAVGKVQPNIDKMVGMIREAASEGADIIVFPELFSTGYNLELMGDLLDDISEWDDGPVLNAARKEAAQNGIYTILGVPYKENGKRYNSAVVIDSSGKVLNVYHKNNLWDAEQDYFEYGDHDYTVYDSPFGRFGVLVCYDVDFPETCRRLALAGAQMIFISAAWCTTHRNLWDIYIPARALENTVFVAGVNRTGVEGSVIYFGDSKVCDPTGAVIARAGENSEEILYCEADVDAIESIRDAFPYLRELREYPPLPENKFKK